MLFSPFTSLQTLCFAGVLSTLFSCSGSGEQVDIIPALAVDASATASSSNKLQQDDSDLVPAPTNLVASVQRAGYVALQWSPSNGDTDQLQPHADTVSYYRVYRNDELLTESFIPAIEDMNVPSGTVRYSVEAVKFINEPEFALLESKPALLTVDIETAENERALLNGVVLDEPTFTNELGIFAQCELAVMDVDGRSFCSNYLGLTWPVSADGEAGALFDQTISIRNNYIVKVSNTPSDIGPVPGLPVLTVEDIDAGQVVTHSMELHSSGKIHETERYLVSGVAVASDGTAFISGSIYQSYVPRTLGPSPVLLPVTSAYYLAQYNLSSGELMQLKRYSIANSPGAAAVVRDGVLELYHHGLVTSIDTPSLTNRRTVRVTGQAVFGSDDFVYTQFPGSTDYYRFERHH